MLSQQLGGGYSKNHRLHKLNEESSTMDHGKEQDIAYHVSMNSSAIQPGLRAQMKQNGVAR